MIDLHTWTTPNGYKISIMLEELGLPYNVVPVNLGQQQQFTPEFAAMNPNRRIPVIVDHDVPGGPLAIFESGAILIYLAEKTGRFLPTDARPRAAVLQWLMFQMSAVGPMIGQLGYFFNMEEKVPVAIQRFIDESLRIIGVLNEDLKDREYLAGEYSIADMATYPWISAAWKPMQGMFPDKVAELAQVKAWLDRVGARPAVQKGMAVPKI
jgi:GST-like protein